MQKIRRPSQSPVAWPRTGEVSRLYLNAISGNGVSIYITQSNWPRQRKNPQWRIHIEGIDSRYAIETRENIQNECLKATYAWLENWLSQTAPIITLDSATWQDLVRFSQLSPSPKSDFASRRLSYRPGKSRFHPSRSKSASRKAVLRPEG